MEIFKLKINSHPIIKEIIKYLLKLIFQEIFPLFILIFLKLNHFINPLK